MNPSGGTMFIQTEATSNPDVMKFYPGEPVLSSGEQRFAGADESARSPLAERLFAVEFVQAVTLGSDFVSVEKADDSDWQLMKPAILGAIMEHYIAGIPVLVEEDTQEAAVEEDFDQNIK